MRKMQIKKKWNVEIQTVSQYLNSKEKIQNRSKHKPLKTRVRMKCKWMSKHPLPTGHTRHVLFDKPIYHFFKKIIKAFEEEVSDWPLGIELDGCF